MVKTYQATTRCDLVSPTSSGCRKDRAGASSECQPIFWLQRP